VARHGNTLIKNGQRVFVHWNLHKDTYTVQDASSGLVIGYLDELVIYDAHFVVRPAGLAKTRREGRKNVHAGVRGFIDKTSVSHRGASGVTYDPYRYDTFVTRKKKEPVYHASTVIMRTTMVKIDKEQQKIPRVYARGLS
jgi:hypothetical protein